MGYATLIVERRGTVGWLVFNRPAVGNAMDGQMLGELETAWKELDRDPEVRVIVNTGAGPSFQTGLDVAQLSKDREALREQSRRTRDFDLRFTSWQLGILKPVIAAVNGVCAGGGLHFVADADIVIASSAASFLDPHTSIGQAVAYEAITLMRKMAAERVMRMAFTGRYERVSAEEAYRCGMVSQVVDPPERLEDEAQALAEKVARNSPAAMRATKQALWGTFELGLSDACRAGSQHLVSMWGHPDQEEGPLAFAEKRQPEWTPVEA
jgi:enoyl-CoA hydratase/carnithine racemase